MGNTFAKAIAWDLAQEGFKVEVPQMKFDDWERKEHDVLAVIVVSQISDERLFISVETKNSWKITDRGYGASYEVPVPITLAWTDALTWLKNRA